MSECRPPHAGVSPLTLRSVERHMPAYHRRPSGVSRDTCPHITRDTPEYHAPHAGISPETLRSITRHMPAYHRRHSGVSRVTCRSITGDTPEYHASHAGISPVTLPGITRHMPGYRRRHSRVSRETLPSIALRAFPGAGTGWSGSDNTPWSHPSPRRSSTLPLLGRNS